MVTGRLCIPTRLVEIISDNCLKLQGMMTGWFKPLNEWNRTFK